MRCDERGVTLVEIGVVLAIIGSLAVMSLPSIFRWQQALELRDASSEISTMLMQARTRSITERKNYTVVFSEAANTYTFAPDGGPAVGRLGEPWKRVDLYDDGTDPSCPTFSGWTVVFRPDSSADTAGYEAIYLRSQDVVHRYRVKVLGATGKITVEKWQGVTWGSVY